MPIRMRLGGVARRTAWRQLRWAWALAALLAAVAPGVGPWPVAAAAQPAPALATLRISLWPEFDRQAVLVILDGSLTPGTALPAEVSLRMPAAAGQPNAAAFHAADGSLLTAAYTTALAGSDLIVTLSTESLDFRLEYYDTALAINGDRRTFSFRWTTDYATMATAVRVQQPVGAREFATIPALTASGAGEYGLDYYEGDLGALAVGQAVQVTISYRKAGASLSNDTVGVAPVATAAAPPIAGGASTPTLLAAAGLGVALAAAVTFIFMRGRRTARPAAARRRTARRQPGRPATRRESAAPAASAASRREAALDDEIEAAVAQRRAGTEDKIEAAATQRRLGVHACGQCGAKVMPDDRFCPQCGLAQNVTCADCGRIASTGDQYCGGCGLRLPAPGDGLSQAQVRGD
jgi:double zinc ribbon protein